MESAKTTPAIEQLLDERAKIIREVEEEAPYRGVFVPERRLLAMIEGTPEESLDCDIITKIGIMLRRKLYESHNH